jgi:hypothetical protein
VSRIVTECVQYTADGGDYINILLMSQLPNLVSHRCTSGAVRQGPQRERVSTGG